MPIGLTHTETLPLMERQMTAEDEICERTLERLKEHAETMAITLEKALADVIPDTRTRLVAYMARQAAAQKPDCLDRTMNCECGWTGRLGEVIAADKLRCPKCRSVAVGYLTPDTASTVQ